MAEERVQRGLDGEPAEGPVGGAAELQQEIRFCTTPDGVQIAYATVGRWNDLIGRGWMSHIA